MINNNDIEITYYPDGMIKLSTVKSFKDSYISLNTFFDSIEDVKETFYVTDENMITDDELAEYIFFELLDIKDEDDDFID